jgi:hypothetical protein
MHAVLCFFFYIFILFLTYSECRVLSSRCLARLLGITDHIVEGVFGGTVEGVREEVTETHAKTHTSLSSLPSTLPSTLPTLPTILPITPSPTPPTLSSQPPSTQYVWALELLLPKCLSPNLPKRHGAVLAVAEIVLCASLAATATANHTGTSLFSGIVLHCIMCDVLCNHTVS